MNLKRFGSLICFQSLFVCFFSLFSSLFFVASRSPISAITHRLVFRLFVSFVLRLLFSVLFLSFLPFLFGYIFGVTFNYMFPSSVCNIFYVGKGWIVIAKVDD